MVEFFRAVGFPEAEALRANERYKREFSRKYPVGLFPGVATMLATLAASGLRLGIVSSNTRGNISSALGDSLKFFDASCVFTDDDARRVTKAEALVICARIAGATLESTLYIGDQPRDFAAAQTAHVRFLGVTYGWGIEADDIRFPIAKSPEDIAGYLGASAQV